MDKNNNVGVGEWVHAAGLDSPRKGSQARMPPDAADVCSSNE